AYLLTVIMTADTWGPYVSVSSHLVIFSSLPPFFSSTLPAREGTTMAAGHTAHAAVLCQVRPPPYATSLPPSAVVASRSPPEPLAGSSRVLCLAAGAGNAVDALHAAGVSEVTGIDLVDFSPLVRRADPHRLPFSDGAFDLIFSDDPSGISGALFPARVAAEAERALRRGGAIALAV
uniref:Methyltransferase type 11 domain-containing protein n=1 Tax=Aegilops tauschii subsp. strangulata TaxID=200361 RepID=A0A452ZE16_AEGTS